MGSQCTECTRWKTYLKKPNRNNNTHEIALYNLDGRDTRRLIEENEVFKFLKNGHLSLGDMKCDRGLRQVKFNCDARSRFFSALRVSSTQSIISIRKEGGAGRGRASFVHWTHTLSLRRGCVVRVFGARGWVFGGELFVRVCVLCVFVFCVRHPV